MKKATATARKYIAASARLRTELLRGLHAAGFGIGHVITWTQYSKTKTFTIASIRTGQGFGSSSVALYGHQHRKDGTVGKHVHYIGSLR